MAQPKKKTSHQKQHSRRANWKAGKITIVVCLNCNQPARPHEVCQACGYYRGRPARLKDSILNQPSE